MLFGLLLTLGVAVLSVGLRTFHNSYAQKAGALGILAATFLGFYFATNNWVWGLVAALAWLFLPWLEILTRIRALRLPKEKQLRPKSPPSSDTFPALSEITREIEDEAVRLRERCRVGLGRLPAVFPIVLQRRRSCPGRDLPE